MAKRRGGSAYERTFLGIAVTVTVVWAISTLAQVVSPAHQVPLTVNATMGIVATGLFGAGLLAGRNGRANGGGDRKAPPSYDEMLREARRRAKLPEEDDEE